ncbi:LysR substrate-binding domain-containing protein [Bradyrhizobium sp. USDA 4515]
MAIGRTGSKRQGSTTLPASPRQIFDHFHVARQAVEDGLGIGIGPLPMLEIDVANGRLMTPLPDIRVPRTGYVAVTPRHADAGNLVAGFVDWLVAEARGAVGENKAASRAQAGLAGLEPIPEPAHDALIIKRRHVRG